MKTQDALVLWIAEACLATAPFDLQRVVVEEVRQRVEEGKSLDTAIESVTDNKSRAGDFGIDISGSTIAVLMLHVLVGFWSAYIKELKKKSSKKLADATIDFVKNAFAADLKSPKGREILLSVESAVRKRAEELRISKKKTDELVAALRSAKPFKDLE